MPVPAFWPFPQLTYIPVDERMREVAVCLACSIVVELDTLDVTRPAARHREMLDIGTNIAQRELANLLTGLILPHSFQPGVYFSGAAI